MDKLTKTNLPERIKDSSLFALGSAVLIAITQFKEDIHQILTSSGVEFIQTLFTSFINGTFYNELKKAGNIKTSLSNKEIIYYSAILVSIFGVGVPKYIIHKIAGTNNIELITLFYVIINIIAMTLYEKHILQKR